MTRTVLTLALAAGSLIAAGNSPLPLSKELVQGDTTIMLGTYSARLMAQTFNVQESTLYVKGEGNVVAVKTDCPNTTTFVVTVTTRSADGQTHIHTERAARAAYGYTLVFVRTEAMLDDVMNVSVDKVATDATASF